MSRTLDQRLQSLIDRSPIVPRRKSRIKKMRMPKDSFSIDPTRLDECCESELVAITRRLGCTSTSRAMTSDDLIAIITGEAEEEPGIDILSSIRDSINTFVQGNRSIIAISQMRCDLQCLQCPHHQVVECYTVNQDLVE